MSMSSTQTDPLLADCLSGGLPQHPLDDTVAQQLIERAAYHGVLGLLHDRLQRTPTLKNLCQQTVVTACREGAVAQAMWELRHRALLRDVLQTLADIDVIPVLFKGTALAYSLYRDAALRSRGDTDFIIPPADRDRTWETLGNLGFVRAPGITGECVSYEASFVRTEPGKGVHILDVHWRINNSELLSRLFTHDELLAASQPVPALGPHARVAAPTHAMLIACMHRATHKHNPYYVNGVPFYSGDRLIWLYDIHLLAGSFTNEQWTEFVCLAVDKGLCAVCLEGLERARTSFGTAIPAYVQARLARVGNSEKVTRYFAASSLRQQWMDFVALPSITSKLRFLADTVFPPEHYMREKYPEGGWLPWLYLRRVRSGVVRRLRRTGQAS